MGNVSQKDYFWSYTDEPHATRRKEIIAKYPEIKSLFGHDSKTKFVVAFWVSTQFALAYALQHSNWWMIVACAYFYGAFASQALVLGMHEISHNLAFAKPTHNRLLGIFANIATVISHFSMFQKYHMEHHQFQGVDGIDSDVPSIWEGKVFCNSFGKLLWIMLQPVFYVTRPLCMKPKKPGFWEAMNWSAVILVDIAILMTLGQKSLGYLFLSIFLGCGLHPVAGHFIAEHYVFVKGIETYSYYGPLNMICFNVGYHNEHHDFPRIPGSRLPQVKAMAPEYYDNLPCYNSWTRVIWDYITDPEIGPYSRVMRKTNRAPKDE